MKEFDKIKSTLISTIQTQLLGTDSLAIAFSGSLDSSLVTYIVLRYTIVKPHLYTIGYPDCYDFIVAKKSYECLNMHNNLEHTFITLTDDIVEEKLSQYQKLTNDIDKVSISFTLPFFILLERISENVIMTGHGADTLFGGFHKYLKSKKLKVKIKKEYKNFKTLLPTRELLIAKHFDKKLLLPFVEDKLSEEVMKMPDKLFIKGEERKFILRQVAGDLDLPKQIINRPKKAFQYSTGIIKTLKKIW